MKKSVNTLSSDKEGKYSFFLFWWIFSFLYALLFISAEFYDSPVNSLKGITAIISQWIIVSLSGSMVIGIISINRIVFSIAAPILLISSAIAVYFRITMGLSLTPTLIELTMVNEWSTWSTVISLPLVVSVLIMLLISMAVVNIRWRKIRQPKYQWLWFIVFVVGVIAPISIITRFRAPVSARIPYSFYFSFSEWFDNRMAVAEHRNTYENVRVEASGNNPDVIFILGESLRPDHLSLNGYPRITTPLLNNDTSVISFPNITTEYLYTHVSVPHILTCAVTDNPDAAYVSQSFITLFRKAGYHTSWMSNQDEVNTYAYFMHEGDTLIQCNSAKSAYSFDKWTDADLLPHLDAILNNVSAPKLIVLHTIGSHWWYPSHYPDSLALFKPEVNSRILSELTREQIVNSYDNTILATDQFLSQVISRLTNRNAIMIYISDHGEALGEDGNYLHAQPYVQLHNTACIVWYSPEYQRLYPDKVKSLKENSTKDFTTEAMFHSVMDAASLFTSVSEPKKSIFHNFSNK